MNLRTKIVAGAAIAFALAPMMITPMAQASTLPAHVKAVHIVYLRKTPHLGVNGIRLEKNGAQFTVEPGSDAGWWHVKDAAGREGYVIRNTHWIVPMANKVSISVATSTAATSTATTAPSAPQFTTAAALPPGVTEDATVHPEAGPTSSWQAKFNAVQSVAVSKLGTPYIWGHNEDRGQYGFDCSNFTAYVYHHALGYKMSGASQTQAKSIGWVVPESSMRPGDLLIFENGAHVGIYLGNNEMIQEGGGLKKVGYLSVAPGTYWAKHLTSVKRMF